MLFLTVSFSSNVQANDDYQEVKEIIYDFIKFKKEVVLYGEIEVEFLKDNIKCSESQFTNIVNDALNERDNNDSSSRLLVGYSVKLHNFYISKEKDVLVVTFLEDYEENYEWTDSYIYTKDGSVEAVSPGKKDKSAGNNRENVIKLKKDKNDEWMIIDHIVYVMVVKKKTQKTLEKLKQFGEIFKSKENNGLDLLYPDKESMPSLRPVDGKYRVKEIESDEDETKDDMDSMLILEDRTLKSSLTLASWAWNGNAAGTYSDQYALNYNSNYRSYSEDCTNFASQALYAGGKPYRDGNRTEYPYWFYGMFTFTTNYSWAGSMNLATHLWGYTNSDLFPTSIFQIERGDLIFFDFTNDGIMDHTMILSSVIYNENNPNGYVNGHTNNQYRTNLVNLLNSMSVTYPNLVIYIGVIGNQYTNCPQCPW